MSENKYPCKLCIFWKFEDFFHVYEDIWDFEGYCKHWKIYTFGDQTCDDFENDLLKEILTQIEEM